MLDMLEIKNQINTRLRWLSMTPEMNNHWVNCGSLCEYIHEVTAHYSHYSNGVAAGLSCTLAEMQKQ